MTGSGAPAGGRDARAGVCRVTGVPRAHALLLPVPISPWKGRLSCAWRVGKAGGVLLRPAWPGPKRWRGRPLTVRPCACAAPRACSCRQPLPRRIQQRGSTRCGCCYCSHQPRVVPRKGCVEKCSRPAPLPLRFAGAACRRGAGTRASHRARRSKRPATRRVRPLPACKRALPSLAWTANPEPSYTAVT